MCRACFKFTSSAKGNSLADAGHVNVTIYALVKLIDTLNSSTVNVYYMLMSSSYT
jgi:hypothetical protein